jgi:hypothetical protein
MYHIIIISVLLLLFFACSSTTQIGKIFATEEANKLFGDVIYSVDINSNVVLELLNKTEKKIMFGLINRKLIILDNKRNLIYPEKAEFKDTDVFTVYSTDIVRKLILNNEAGNVSAEQRKEVLSVSTQKSTLEAGAKCPPYCNNN